MNILMVLDEEFPPDVRVEKEALSLVRHNHDVTLLCYSKNESTIENYKGINLIRTRISPLTYKFKALALSSPVYFSFWRKIIKKQLKKDQYDVIHFHDLTLAKVCLEIGKTYSMPVVGDYHENRPEIMKLYRHVRTFPGNILISASQWLIYEQKYTSSLDRLILVTEEAKKDYLQRIDLTPEKIKVVPNFPDLTELLSYKAQQSIIEKYKSKFTIIYFGDTGLRRGTKTLLQAANDLKNKTNYHFIIIGTSREQNILEQYVEDKQLHNVELLGYVPVEEAVSYIKASSAGICPFLRNKHHDTTYANKLFQYMAFGKPVIISDCPAQVNIVKESACGVIFEAGNKNELVEQILHLNSKEVYQDLSANAFNAVHQKYNYKKAEHELLKIYQDFKK